jgi:hypothetical protein
MLGEVMIEEVCIVRGTGDSYQPIRWILLANAGVALITSSAALVLLLIAPLGIAAVLACTGSVAVLSFVVGVMADLVLWRGLITRRKSSAPWNATGRETTDRRMGLPPGAGDEGLPARRQR